MAITISELTSAWSDTDATSYAVASTSPTANALLLLLWTTRHGTTAPGLTPTSVFSGTWTEQTAEQVDGISAVGFHWMQLGASPGTAGFTLNVDGGVTAIGAGWYLLQVLGHDTVSPIVNHTYGPTGTSGTTGTVSPPAMSNANNAQVIHMHHRVSETQNVEAGWTGATSRTGAAPNMGIQAAWKIGAEDTTPTMTWTTSGRFQSEYVEVKVAGATAAAAPYKWRRNRMGLLVSGM